MKIKKDCFAYDKNKKNCTALNELYCKKEECKFYKNNKVINRDYIETCVENYKIAHLR